MSSKKKIVLSIAAGTLVLAMVAGAAGFFAFSNARAQESLLGRRLNSVVQAVDISNSFGDDDFAHRGVRPDAADFWFDRSNGDAYLAQALGISEEELAAARVKAAELAMQAAVDEGRITQEQADWMKARQALQPYLDRQALSATALGMTVEELDTARQAGTDMQTLLDEQGLTAEEYQAALQEAYKAALQKAVDDGVITQTQMDELLSQQSFGYRMPGMPGKDDYGPQRGGGMFIPDQLPDEDSIVAPDSGL